MERLDDVFELGGDNWRAWPYHVGIPMGHHHLGVPTAAAWSRYGCPSGCRRVLLPPATDAPAPRAGLGLFATQSDVVAAELR
jgi:hypothetical protein